MNIICVGSGNTTGEERYCKYHKCSEKGTQYCCYNLHPLMLYVDKKDNIPIKAWDIIKIKVYQKNIKNIKINKTFKSANQ